MWFKGDSIESPFLFCTLHVLCENLCVLCGKNKNHKGHQVNKTKSSQRIELFNFLLVNFF